MASSTTSRLISPDEIVVEARFTSEYTESRWLELQRMGRERTSAVRQCIDVGPAFEDIESPFGNAFLVVSCFRNENTNSIQWVIRQFPPKPTSAASRKLSERELEMTTRAGGLRPLQDYLREISLSDEAKIASYIVQLKLPRLRWSCAYLHHPVGDAAAAFDELGSNGRIEQFGVRFESGTDGLEEIAVVYVHVPDSYIVKIRARAALDIGDDRALPFGDKIAGIVIARTLTRKNENERK